MTGTHVAARAAQDTDGYVSLIVSWVQNVRLQCIVPYSIYGRRLIGTWKWTVVVPVVRKCLVPYIRKGTLNRVDIVQRDWPETVVQ